MLGKKISENKLKSLLDFYQETKNYFTSNKQAAKAFLKSCPDNQMPPNAPDFIAKTMSANVLFNLDESLVK